MCTHKYLSNRVILLCSVDFVRFVFAGATSASCRGKALCLIDWPERTHTQINWLNLYSLPSTPPCIGRPHTLQTTLHFMIDIIGRIPLSLSPCLLLSPALFVCSRHKILRPNYNRYRAYRNRTDSLLVMVLPVPVCGVGPSINCTNIRFANENEIEPFISLQ